MYIQCVPQKNAFLADNYIYNDIHMYRNGMKWDAFLHIK